MHDTASRTGDLFAQIYGGKGKIVIDVGGLDVNGTLKPFFIRNQMNYICVDMEPHPSVDIVVKPGDKLPFGDGTVDIVVTTSCFEHDPCFWVTFKEIARIVKIGGYIYCNAPSNGIYHGYPGDCWRFFSDAGQALALWAGSTTYNTISYPVKIEETFHVLPLTDPCRWIDFVCVWKRVTDPETNICVPAEIRERMGSLRTALTSSGVKTEARCPKIVPINDKFTP
jgi:SAM-dependent methyltransferase